MKDYFAQDCVGQVRTRRLLSHYYDTYKRTRIFKNILFLSPKGQGKSLLCNAIAQKLGKPAYEIHAETVPDLDYFFDNILVRYVLNQDVTIIFDEIHTLRKSVAEFLLPVLAPNSSNKNTIRYGGSTFEIDFRRFTFLAATTEAQKILTPLRSRLKEVTLIDYTLEELGIILNKGAGNIKIPENVLNYLVRYIRSNARAANMLGQEILDYCGNLGKTTLELTDAKELISILNLHEYGFTELEVHVLAAIAKAKNSSLTRLAAKSGLTAQAQRDFERMLLAYDLIDIDNGRRITDQGKEYLFRNLNKV
jgi:Holliday junction resolvasome RuvABC ATP-dependent DNA helicase subunit